ncbi:MAG: hypothetical protein NTU41_00015 [Chloroflexi bacterium]|nr:hypothetical protein [Chloroflexota bacterium]
MPAILNVPGRPAHRSRAYVSHPSQPTKKMAGGVSRGAKVFLPLDLYELVRAYAEEYGLYYNEACAHLVAVGLCGVYHWDTDTGLAQKYFPYQLPKMEDIDFKVTTRELAIMEVIRRVLEKRCPPDKIVLRAEEYPNLAKWAQSMGIRWEHKVKKDLDYPKEYD